MMHSGKHWRLPTTTPENVPLITGTSTRWQVNFLGTNCAAAISFLVSFIQLSSCSQVIDKPLQRQAHLGCIKTQRRQDAAWNDICSKPSKLQCFCTDDINKCLTKTLHGLTVYTQWTVFILFLLVTNTSL